MVTPPFLASPSYFRHCAGFIIGISLFFIFDFPASDFAVLQTVSSLPIKAAEQLAVADQQPDEGKTWQERAVKKAEGQVSALKTLLANLRKEFEVAQQRAVEAELKASKSEAKAADAEKRASEAEAVAEGRAQAAAAEARERAVAVYKKSPAYGNELAEAYNNGIADALTRVMAAFPEVDVGTGRRLCL